MKVLDGRNSNKAPKIIEISSFITMGKWTNTNDGENIYCLQLDNKFVPCVSSNNNRYKYILCAEYKTKKGFEKWLEKHFPLARKEQ